HGTDASVVNDILKNGFIYKPNDEHWLGDGIYFFLDENLAEWWTTNPTKKSGMHIQILSYIKLKTKKKKQ
ncbi:MAG: hypothetical protein IKK46_02615, partial [Clostridia bacterium]|nr:hypothetical protein [Clostridia bacterium]